MGTSRLDNSCQRSLSKYGTSVNAPPWSKCSDSTLRHCNFAISCSETVTGTERTQTHEDLYIGSPPSHTNRDRKSQISVHGCKLELGGKCLLEKPPTHRPSTQPPQASSKVAPPLPTRSSSQVYIPQDGTADAGRTRRDQAALLARSGPPRTRHVLRPISATPTPCMLTKEMILDVCGVDCPEEVQVLSENN